MNYCEEICLSTSVRTGAPINEATVTMWRAILGDFCFARWCADMGLPFEFCYFLMFGVVP